MKAVLLLFACLLVSCRKSDSGRSSPRIKFLLNERAKAEEKVGALRTKFLRLEQGAELDACRAQLRTAEAELDKVHAEYLNAQKEEMEWFNRPKP
jgi:hypothetical protein